MVLNKYLQVAEGEDALRRSIDSQQPLPGDLELGPLLGSGSFGRVYRVMACILSAAKWRGAAVAVKIIRHQGFGTVTNGKVSKEAMIGQNAVHPNVVAVYAVLTQPHQHQCPEGGLSRPDENVLETLLIMERADRGSLQDHLERLSDGRKLHGARGYSAILCCLLDVVYGLEYLHSINVVHGDLKPANVLCKSSGSDLRGYVCKLCDFGLASSNQAAESVYSTGKGTLLYAPPERLRGESLTPANDVYSFGVLAWQMLDDEDTQAHMPQLQLVHQVLNNDWRPDFPANTPLLYREMVCAAWETIPSKRPSFSSIRGMLNKMLADLSPS